jgi:hypothetical protein
LDAHIIYRITLKLINPKNPDNPVWMAIKNGTSWQAKSDTFEKMGKKISLPFALCPKAP